jgi:hypothetical protein
MIKHEKEEKQPFREKRQNENYGVLWTTASVIHMFRDL